MRKIKVRRHKRNLPLSSYFLKGGKDIKIKNLVFDHNPTQKSVNEAKRRMSMAASGKMPKRKPISVRKLQNKKYYVMDGNTTASVLKSRGYKFVRAKIS